MSLADILHVAEDAIARRTETPAEAQALAISLRADAVWLEIVPGMDSVTALFDPLRTSLEDASQRLARAAPAPLPQSNAAPLIIPILYGGEDGPDFDQLCKHAGLSPEAFIAKHTSGLHTAEMIGFTPGFAYVSGLDPLLNAPRLKTPRVRVPAGSVGISAGYTGLYALQGPGGWPIIGRAEKTLFDADADDPFLVQPGQRIRFISA